MVLFTAVQAIIIILGIVYLGIWVLYHSSTKEESASVWIQSEFLWKYISTSAWSTALDSIIQFPQLNLLSILFSLEDAQVRWPQSLSYQNTDDPKLTLFFEDCRS